MTKLYSEGLWENLSTIENKIALKIESILSPLNGIVQELYECGIEAPTLEASNTNTIDQRVSALFLKRVLTDLRTIWKLLIQGYTSQAGCIAASLFESALTVTLIAGNELQANKVLSSEKNELPWKPMELCKLNAYEESEETSDEEEFHILWTQMYSQYKWLCQIKHPTLLSAIHDSGATKTSSEYIIMTLPDLRKQDFPVKMLIIQIVISRTLSAIQKFVSVMDINKSCKRYLLWEKKFNLIEENSLKAMEMIKGKQLPFDISHIDFSKYRS